VHNGAGLRGVYGYTNIIGNGKIYSLVCSGQFAGKATSITPFNFLSKKKGTINVSVPVHL
jgi:hypothetical protein